MDYLSYTEHPLILADLFYRKSNPFSLLPMLYYCYMQEGRDYIGVGVGAAILNREGKVFITKRGKNAKNEVGKWEFPGGSVAFGETLEEALKREIKEEHGVEIIIQDLLGICNHIIPEENQHWIAPAYICTILNGTPKILEPEKCEEIGWFTLTEAATLPLSIVTTYDISLLHQKFPEGLPIF